MILLRSSFDVHKSYGASCFFSLICLLLLFSKCHTPSIQEGTGEIDHFASEDHRPQFHFSPKSGWMNDPNGMVYLDGTYHLFYQYYPDSTVWGPMHWGHTVSRDLIHWEHLPIAIYPDSLGWIFSGSAVYDKDNTSGLGKDGQGPLVAIFSHHNAPLEQTGSDLYQYQSIAYSNDQGMTWQAYSGNPILNNPGIRDFRDPKVFWHKPSQSWVMVLAALNKIMFYGSKNLIEWSYLSEFGAEVGSHDGVWECPDLFPLTDEKGELHWVLIVNMNPGNPNGGSGTQYFIGDFDGVQFKVNPAFANLLQPIPTFAPEGEVYEDFENGLERWTQQEDIFLIVSQKNGKGSMISSGSQGNTSTGRLVSDEFTISTNAINFQVAGGYHRGKTFIGLSVDGKMVREMTGDNTERLTWKGWDVSPFIGKKAQIHIIDAYQHDYGYLSVDQITFADEVAHGDITGSVWLDAGADNYAGVTWSNIPASDGRRIFIGWMSNWAYAQVVPTLNWRSAMTLPWALKIRSINNIPYLTGTPVVDTKKLRKNIKLPMIEKDKEYGLPESGLLELKLVADASEDFIFEVGNKEKEAIFFTYQAQTAEFIFNREKSGKTDFSPDFVKRHTAQRKIVGDTISLHIWLDRSSIEIFLDDGATVFTELFFPHEDYNYLKWRGSDLLEAEVYELKGIW